MAIKFENIDNGQTLAIDQESEGAYYGAKLSAVINSSNLSINADRGQDYGWRLDPEQQALIEEWEQDGQMIDRVANHFKTPVDSLSHTEFLQYLVYTQSLGTSPERREVQIRRERQAEYDARVSKLRSQSKPEPMAPFEAPSLDDFMNGDLTGDASGDKVVDEASEVDPALVAKVEIPADVKVESTPAKKPAKK